MIERRALILALGVALVAAPAFGDSDCKYKGAIYSHGATACQFGSRYRCDDGEWSGLAIACGESLWAGTKNCTFNGVAYFPGSASCQAGTQYRCDGGTWMSLSVACTVTGQIASRVVPVGRTRVYDGAPVATESSMCGTDITFRCGGRE